MKCSTCDNEMTDSIPCTLAEYDDFTDGVTRQRIPNQTGYTCHDCKTPDGGLHHPGCDAERCPGCGGQAIGCDCTDPDEDDD